MLALSGVVSTLDSRELGNRWPINMKNAVRLSSLRQGTTVRSKCLRRTGLVVLLQCVSSRESSDAVVISMRFRLSTASSTRDMGLKTSTASTSVRPRRMVKSWATTGVRYPSDTLLKRPILAQARGRGYTAAVQAIVTQLAAYATRTASDALSTAISALASVPIRQQARAIPR
jgi:hypothetical protein